MTSLKFQSIVVSVLPPAIAAVTVALLAESCSPVYTAPAVTAPLVKISSTPKTQLERGYSVHQAKCAKCHPFENPTAYEVDELTHEILPEMARKAKLAPADQQAVLAYLLAVRRIPQGPP